MADTRDLAASQALLPKPQSSPAHAASNQHCPWQGRALLLVRFEKARQRAAMVREQQEARQQSLPGQ